MADIIQNEHKQKTGVPKTKKASLRVDLTPMVDLGFLLIAFFVLTTTILTPTSMRLALPDDSDTSQHSKTPENKTLNLLLGANNEAFVYAGSALKDIKSIGTNATALRTAILEKKNAIRKSTGSDSRMVVLIKPSAEASYANIINALDEMLICNVKSYVLMDAGNSELKSIGL